MKGVKFGSKHSYDDFGLLLTSEVIGFPEPKTETESIPGMDGEIDFTEAFGKVFYKNRKLTFTFTAISTPMQWDPLIENLTVYLHGKVMRIIRDSDAGYYYYGRCKINSFQSDKRTAKIVIECNVSPFKEAV